MNKIDALALVSIYTAAAVLRMLVPYGVKKLKDPALRFDWRYVGTTALAAGYGALAAAPEALPRLVDLPPYVSVPLAAAAGAGMNDLLSRALDTWRKVKTATTETE